MELGYDTPFSRVLNTNYSPSSPEQHLLRDLVRGPEEQIRLLDEEISRLQAKRQMLKQFVDLHRALLSPFRRVPADVWRLIFVETLPDHRIGLCTRTTKSSPLLLTTICRFWREIALGTPRLWNSIHIHLPIESSRSPDLECITTLHRRKEGLKAWLDRSGSLPITFSLTVRVHSADGRSAPQSEHSTPMAEPLRVLTTEFIELLIQYAPRWRTVVFNTGVHLLDLTSLERIPTSSLPNLESFYSFGVPYLHGRGTVSPVDHGPSHPSPLQGLPCKARSLRRLELLYNRISTATLSLPISWHHLTELSIIHPFLFSRDASLHPSQLIQTLATKCHSLITLSMSLEARPGPNTIPHAVQWPSLQNLRIFLVMGSIQWFSRPPNTSYRASSNTATFQPKVVQMFDAVTLPSLKKLSVAFYGDGEDSNNHAARLPFENLLQRSQCPLTHLELFHPRIVTAEAIIRVLRQLETLVSLNLGYSRLTGKERREGFQGKNVEPSERWFDRNIATPWRRKWLDRILQEFLVDGSDSDVEPPADESVALPLCPQLEELNLGGCVLDDRDILLDFAMRTRRENLRTFRVDLGRPIQGDVWKIFDSLQMERQDSEGMRVVRDVGGVTLDWRWDEQSEIPRPVSDGPTTGLLEEDAWWNESLWL
ncbi:hypothetical protein PM082_023278 [Marasmius tenuissimus]|nr:hypothetical protein PM082_023278 [Marasmius tenuissimus]